MLKSMLKKKKMYDDMYKTIAKDENQVVITDMISKVKEEIKKVNNSIK